MLRQTIPYCEKQNGKYQWFFKSVVAVEMCGVDTKDIVKVKLREVREGETPTHCAWWENEDSEFRFIFDERYKVELCFPEGTRPHVEMGQGNVYGVVVEEVEG